MSEQPNHYPHKPPFKTLGKYLKTLRQKQQESLGETSGAVEIDVEKLDRFERGVEPPSEDILLLLISHFGLKDEEAIELWELAGYSRNDAETTFDRNRPAAPAMQVTLLAMDNRVLHSNGVEIVTDNSDGVVLNFLQSGAGNQQSYVVSRVGMSAVQAHNLLETLQSALLHQKYAPGPKALPADSTSVKPKQAKPTEDDKNK
jgi:transcriptional regulator with XRE-family HTH domain